LDVTFSLLCVPYLIGGTSWIFLREDLMALDSPAIVRLLMAERSRLFSYTWAIVGDVHLAEDVFQEVSLLAIEKGK
jgi:DNA-directed RNA polymerase specialized sigma24 family protein